MKIEVNKLGGLRTVVDIDPKATNGATIGKNVFNADGSLFYPVQSSSASSPSAPSVPITDWGRITSIPPNVWSLGTFSGTGLYAITGAGTSAGRTITGTAPITVTNGDGVSGNPLVEVQSGDIVAGANVTIIGTTSKRLLGAGNITISASGGGGGGGGGMSLISQVVVTSAQTDIDFYGLDLVAAGIYQLELFLVPGATGTQQAVRLQFNGDSTAANYRRRRLTAFGTSSVSSAAASDEAIVTATGGNTGALAQAQKTTIRIAQAAGTYPVADGRTSGWSGVGQMWVEETSVSRLDVANVTSIRLRHETANGFGVGTFARLYAL